MRGKRTEGGKKVRYRGPVGCRPPREGAAPLGVSRSRSCGMEAASPAGEPGQASVGGCPGCVVGRTAHGGHPYTARPVAAASCRVSDRRTARPTRRTAEPPRRRTHRAAEQPEHRPADPPEHQTSGRPGDSQPSSTRPNPHWTRQSYGRGCCWGSRGGRSGSHHLKHTRTHTQPSKHSMSHWYHFAAKTEASSPPWGRGRPVLGTALPTPASTALPTQSLLHSSFDEWASGPSLHLPSRGPPGPCLDRPPLPLAARTAKSSDQSW